MIRLRGIPEVHKVILFGSYAKGRRDLFTDLDLIVVMDSRDDFVTRCAELARIFRLSRHGPQRISLGCQDFKQEGGEGVVEDWKNGRMEV